MRIGFLAWAAVRSALPCRWSPWVRRRNGVEPLRAHASSSTRVPAGQAQVKRPGVGNETLRKCRLELLGAGASLVRLLLFSGTRPTRKTRKRVAASERCLVRLDNRSVAPVAIDINGTVLEFPMRPTKVILGRNNSFGIEYVESDLAISPLAIGARSHLYVYLQGRRFTFDLSTTVGGGCAVITVRDSKDNQVSVDGFFRPKK